MFRLSSDKQTGRQADTADCSIQWKPDFSCDGRVVGWIAAVLIGANDLGANHFGICFDKDVVNLLSICLTLETAVRSAARRVSLIVIAVMCLRDAYGMVERLKNR